ncbi:DUF2917 domain-containing protein [Burkholderia stagnalis]|nr:DUF2917 domain-containing protein [Burkholderia stagnalis]RQY02609.1 DUF2917 domain-containing protein [Burkholderia stagnalis]RQY20012.1 DUF2917 domain-containing protein [Burkholderia stagnalis]RQY31201.1 DUF2917 domain-containing protein [Burkholderia stagnalis]
MDKRDDREGAMRELRLYELDADEPAGRWRPVRRTLLRVTDGELWLTIEGEPADHWLRPGDVLTLAPGARVWLSAGPPGARFALSRPDAHAASLAAALRQRLAGWLGRGRQADASLPT